MSCASSLSVFAFWPIAPAKRLMFTGLATTKGIFASAQAIIKGCSTGQDHELYLDLKV
jgi:hypothetical protein